MENLNLKSEIEKNINISVVSAVYNEEDNLKQFIERLEEKDVADVEIEVSKLDQRSK